MAACVVLRDIPTKSPTVRSATVFQPIGVATPCVSVASAPALREPRPPLGRRLIQSTCTDHLVIPFGSGPVLWTQGRPGCRGFAVDADLEGIRGGVDGPAGGCPDQRQVVGCRVGRRLLTAVGVGHCNHVAVVGPVQTAEGSSWWQPTWAL